MTPGRYEAEQDWFAERAMLLDVHDNVVDILGLYCIRLLLTLEQYEKAAALRQSVLQPMERRDYANRAEQFAGLCVERPGNVQAVSTVG